MTPLARAVTHRIGPIDQPKRRQIHGKPISLGGGVAIWLALFGGLAICRLGPTPTTIWFAEHGLFLPGLLFASLVILAVGLVDDFRGLRYPHKLVGQLVAVGLVMASGVTVQRIQFFDWEWELGSLGWLFTAFWLLGCIHSLNLLDRMDGLLCCVAVIISLALAAMATLGGQDGAACVAAALAGALLGFLRYNFPPATIVLRGSGS